MTVTLKEYGVSILFYSLLSYTLDHMEENDDG